jgi:hypothetical protein
MRPLRGIRMKILVLITAMTVSLSVLGSVAGAQAPADQAPMAPRAQTINLTVENRHVIKEIIKDMHVANTADEVAVSVGAEVPQSVALQPMPAPIAQKVPQVKSHEFFVKNDKIALVDPKNRKIVEVIE